MDDSCTNKLFQLAGASISPARQPVVSADLTWRPPDPSRPTTRAAPCSLCFGSQRCGTAPAHRRPSVGYRATVAGRAKTWAGAPAAQVVGPRPSSSSAANHGAALGGFRTTTQNKPATPERARKKHLLSGIPPQNGMLAQHAPPGCQHVMGKKRPRARASPDGPELAAAVGAAARRSRRLAKAAAVVQQAQVVECAPEAQKQRPAAGRRKKLFVPVPEQCSLDQSILEQVLTAAHRLTTPPADTMMWVGAHVSTAGGLARAVVNAAAIGAKAFALDTRSKRRWDTPPLLPEVAAAFREACAAFGFDGRRILPHGSYLINLASVDPEMQRKSCQAFLEEIQRCEQLGLSLYNFHPGHTCGLCTDEEGLDLVADNINKTLEVTQGVTIVLENTAGSGSSLGHRFEHLRHIIDRVSDPTRIGVCLDTCHMFAAGYDITTEAGYQATFNQFDEVVGLKWLRGLHVNDSKTPLNSHRDRHENVGRGHIGLKCFRRIMNDARFQGIPLIMETPVQEKEAGVDYKKSLQRGEVVYKVGEDGERVGTDRRDISLLYSLRES